MELYEGRIASMQRFVAMTVMFHEMGMRVQNFFPRISFGYLGYRMDRTHSIMRIATTASPVSGSDVRESIESLRLKHIIQKAVNTISSVYHDHLMRDINLLLRKRSSSAIKSARDSPAGASMKAVKTIRKAQSMPRVTLEQPMSRAQQASLIRQPDKFDLEYDA